MAGGRARRGRHDPRDARVRPTAVHKTDALAELVCSNSFRADKIDNAVGLIKEEMRRLGSIVMRAADVARVPAGAALAVDRHVFSETVTKAVQSHPRIRISREEVPAVPGPEWSPTIIATGPLTSDALSHSIQQMVGEDHLAFYDAISPIVLAESIDQSKVFRASRWGRNVWSRRTADGASGAGLECDVDEGDYLNCPMTKAEYDAFYAALVTAESATVHDFDNTKFFEGCLPIEVMAHRGEGTLRFGPMKPVGPERSADGTSALCRGAAAPGHARRRSLQPGRVSDADQMGRSGAAAEDDPWSRKCRVRSLRHGASQHLYLRAEGAAADVADQAPRRPVLRRPGVGRRGLRGVCRIGTDRRAQRRCAREGRDPAGAAAHHGDRIACLLRIARRSQDLSADQHHARHHAAAR